MKNPIFFSIFAAIQPVDKTRNWVVLVSNNVGSPTDDIFATSNFVTKIVNYNNNKCVLAIAWEKGIFSNLSRGRIFGQSGCELIPSWARGT